VGANIGMGWKGKWYNIHTKDTLEMDPNDLLIYLMLVALAKYSRLLVCFANI
jgi:hypothetical protein